MNSATSNLKLIRVGIFKDATQLFINMSVTGSARGTVTFAFAQLPDLLGRKVIQAGHSSIIP